MYHPFTTQSPPRHFTGVCVNVLLLQKTTEEKLLDRDLENLVSMSLKNQEISLCQQAASVLGPQMQNDS